MVAAADGKIWKRPAVGPGFSHAIQSTRTFPANSTDDDGAGPQKYRRAIYIKQISNSGAREWLTRKKVVVSGKIVSGFLNYSESGGVGIGGHSASTPCYNSIW